MSAVLGTPRVIVLVERTARESMYPSLGDNERTVGARSRFVISPTPRWARA